MANPINTTGTHKSQEKYTNEIVPLIRQEFSIRNDFSRDYEGDPVVGIVKVPTRNGDIKLSDYDILNGITMTQSATDYLDIPVNQEKAFSELIDGYEVETVPDNIRVQRIESAGYVVGKALEESAINALIEGGTVSEDTDALTEDTVYKKIAKEVKNMKKRGIKVSEMRIAISADTELLLLTDEKFANTSGTLGAELVREGVIGKVAGVATKTCYVLPEDVEFVIYAKRWCQAIDAWKAETAINPINDGKHVKASALQGRMVYKDVVTNALAVQIKKSGETYTVTYDSNGGTGSIDAVKVKAGESITLSDGAGLTAPTGKTFKGWAKTDSAQSPSVTSPFTPTKDTTLYAVYGE